MIGLQCYQKLTDRGRMARRCSLRYAYLANNGGGNRVVQDWGKYHGDNTMATTILNRLRRRGHILELKGKSYRLKEAASRLTRLKSRTSYCRR